MSMTRPSTLPTILAIAAVVLAAVAFVMVFRLGGETADLEQELHATESRVRDLSGDVSALSTELEELSTEATEVSERLTELSDSVATLQEVMEAVTSFTVYFTHVTEEQEPELTPVERYALLVPDPVRSPTQLQLLEAFRSLITGPTPAEQEAGLISQLPPAARLLGAAIQEDAALVDFSPELEQVEDAERITAMLQQIARTGTAVPGVERVLLFVDGERVGSEDRPFTAEGFIFEELGPDAEVTVAE